MATLSLDDLAGLTNAGDIPSNLYRNFLGGDDPGVLESDELDSFEVQEGGEDGSLQQFINEQLTGIDPALGQISDTAFESFQGGVETFIDRGIQDALGNRPDFLLPSSQPGNVFEGGVGGNAISPMQGRGTFLPPEALFSSPGAYEGVLRAEAGERAQRDQFFFKEAQANKRVQADLISGESRSYNANILDQYKFETAMAMIAEANKSGDPNKKKDKNSNNPSSKNKNAPPGAQGPSSGPGSGGDGTGFNVDQSLLDLYNIPDLAGDFASEFGYLNSIEDWAATFAPGTDFGANFDFFDQGGFDVQAGFINNYDLGFDVGDDFGDFGDYNVPDLGGDFASEFDIYE